MVARRDKMEPTRILDMEAAQEEPRKKLSLPLRFHQQYQLPVVQRRQAQQLLQQLVAVDSEHIFMLLALAVPVQMRIQHRVRRKVVQFSMQGLI